MKPRIVIVGAGLGGCYLASDLIGNFDVTIVEPSDRKPLLRDCVEDVGCPAITYPNLDSGLGGTTKAWHNALMEIDASVFDKKWPFSKDVLDPYYNRAYKALSGTSRELILKSASSLRNKLIGIGFSQALLSQCMFIPKIRINAWNKLGIQDGVNVLNGEAVDLLADDRGGISKVKIKGADGQCHLISADYFVLAAGGLGTPLILQNLAKTVPLEALKNAGVHYEDHPSAFVGEVELDKPLYKFWNHPVRTETGGGNIRLPLSFYWGGLNISCQLRPAHHLRLTQPRTKIISVLTDLRNFPFKPINYWRLVTHLDDLLDILSFKFGLRIPTKKYSMLVVAEQPPSSTRAVWRSDDNTKICRKWEVSDDYVYLLEESIGFLLKNLKSIIKSFHLFPNWRNNIFSSSHHSGTARLSSSARDGVCDINGKVHGLSNLFVCDGSVIPASGYVNTGLTIVALAMRLADLLNTPEYYKRRES